MAKMKRKKMSTGDAVKILANESKIMREEIFATREMCRDYFSLFELYITWRGKSEDFLKHVKETVEQKNKELEDEQKTDEPTDEKDTGISVTDAKVRSERIRP